MLLSFDRVGWLNVCLPISQGHNLACVCKTAMNQCSIERSVSQPFNEPSVHVKRLMTEMSLTESKRSLFCKACDHAVPFPEVCHRPEDKIMVCRSRSKAEVVHCTNTLQNSDKTWRPPSPMECTTAESLNDLRGLFQLK